MKLLCTLLAMLLMHPLTDLEKLIDGHKKNVSIITNRYHLINLVETSAVTECPNTILLFFDKNGKQVGSTACAKYEFRHILEKFLTGKSTGKTVCTMLGHDFYIFKLGKV